MAVMVAELKASLFDRPKFIPSFTQLLAPPQLYKLLGAIQIERGRSKESTY